MEPRSHPTPPAALDGPEALLLSRLLWAASHDRNERAIAAGRLQLVTALATGVLAYEPRAHALRPLSDLDLRVPRKPPEPRQGFDLIYVATATRCEAATRRVVAAVDSATVAVRVERLCAAYGLWLSPRGPLDARAFEAGLALERPRFVSFVQSIGWTDECRPDTFKA